MSATLACFLALTVYSCHPCDYMSQLFYEMQSWRPRRQGAPGSPDLPAQQEVLGEVGPAVGITVRTPTVNNDILGRLQRYNCSADY